MSISLQSVLKSIGFGQQRLSSVLQYLTLCLRIPVCGHAKVVASLNHRSGGVCQPPIKKSGACQRIGSSSMSIV